MPRLLFLPTLLLLALAAVAQEPGPAKYRMELLSMIRSDSTRGCNDVQASILVIPFRHSRSAKKCAAIFSEDDPRNRLRSDGTLRGCWPQRRKDAEPGPPFSKATNTRPNVFHLCSQNVGCTSVVTGC